MTGTIIGVCRIVKSVLEQVVAYLYSHGMRDLLEGDALHRLDTANDPVERYKALSTLEASVTLALKAERQRIALELRQQDKTWREIGRLLGGVTAQRAEQISKGM